MQISNYQQQVRQSSAQQEGPQERLIMASIGMQEALEAITTPVEQHLGQGTLLQMDRLEQAVGELLWYLTTLCNVLGIDLDEVLQRQCAGQGTEEGEKPGEQAAAMTEQRYLTEVLRTYAGSDDLPCLLTLGALGLAGETGEVVDLVKKCLFQGHGLDREQLGEELGDVLWYFVLLCHATSYSVKQLMCRNVAKLRRRYPQGFEAERSVHRQEEHVSL